MEQDQWLRVYTLLSDKERNDIAQYAIERLMPGFTIKPKAKRKKPRVGPRAIPVELGGIEYVSLTKACEATGIAFPRVSEVARARGVQSRDALIMLFNERMGKIT